MSSQQILSLETDSDVGFFNDQFKVICAKKYINFLKLNADHVIIVPNDESDNDDSDSDQAGRLGDRSGKKLAEKKKESINQ